MGKLDNLKPLKVFYFFEEISNIPRGSGNEKAISDYMVEFGKKRGLYVLQDKSNNILIKKDGTQGYENSAPLIIQGHLDMVCEKNSGTKHDFLTEPLDLQINGDFISANGTTLGADNGIAIAYALAVLDSNDIAHPPLEVVMTTDEEVGMNGAASFDASVLLGKQLLNLDTEEEGKLLVSCCGGMKATISLPISWENSDKNYVPHVLQIKGLKGGHSGADIHLDRANANKLMGRIFFEITQEFDIKVSSINGGAMDNAITRESVSVISIKPKDYEDIAENLKKAQETFNKEYSHSETGIVIEFSKLNENIEKVFSEETEKKAISILMLVPYGVLSMSHDMPTLVESSSNIGIVKTNDTSIKFTSAVRSSVISKKYDIYNKIVALGLLTGSETSYRGNYPSWEFNPDSKLLKVFQEAYIDMYGKKAEVESIHAGLECGLFAEKIKGIDMISIGPEMYDVHTPDERLGISSTERTWDYIKEILKRLK